MRHRIRQAVHLLLLRPLLRLALRLEVSGRHHLAVAGPAIVVANHNSHADTAVLLAAFPTASIPRVRPVAAADYFLRNRLLAWFTTWLVGILPLDRTGASGGDPVAPLSRAILRGEILVLFPEGTRGEPGNLGRLKTGVARVAERHPDVPVIPVWLDGCDRVMPKGAALPRPARCRATVGAPLPKLSGESPGAYASRLRATLLELRPELQEAA